MYKIPIYLKLLIIVLIQDKEGKENILRGEKMKKRLCLFLTIILILIPVIVHGDSFDENVRSVLLGDYESGKIFYEKSIDDKVEIASLTKIMTYLVTMDYVTSGEVNLDDLVTISENAAKLRGSSFMLKEGEEISLRTLLESIMIVSGNDSCVAVAEYIAGSEEKFVKLMNDKAKEIGLTNTYYYNSSGYPLSSGEENYMSTRDLFELTRYVIKKYPQVLEITKKKNLSVPSRNFEKENTNPLLNLIDGIDGFKTGYTDKAGKCLISTIRVSESEDNEKPFRLIGIVMGAESDEERTDVSKRLIEYGLQNYSYKKVLGKNEVITLIEVKNAKDALVDVFPQKDLIIFVKEGQNIEKKITLNENIKAPLSPGDKVGKIVISNGIGEKYSIDLVVNSYVRKKNIFDFIFDLLLGILGV